MLKSSNFLIGLSLLGAIFGTAGCPSIDRIGTRVDSATERVDPAKPIYQGKLVSSREIGAMTSLLFDDGKQFDCSEAPKELLPGDIVRIYQTDKGYEAHLWHSASNDSLIPPAPSSAPTSTPQK